MAEENVNFEFSTTELPPEAVAIPVEVYLPKKEKPAKGGLTWGIGVPIVTLGSEKQSDAAND